MIKQTAFDIYLVLHILSFSGTQSISILSNESEVFLGNIRIRVEWMGGAGVNLKFYYP